MNTKRRDFIKKTAIGLGAIAIAGSAGKLIPDSSGFDTSKLKNEEQIQLLAQFEAWVNNYVEVIKEEKINNREFKDNTALVSLPEEMEKWMPKIKNQLSDRDFAEEYLKISNRLTNAIDARF